jgi:acyl-coenzyme A synthetase/AMP-(fatty) acid ligase
VQHHPRSPFASYRGQIITLERFNAHVSALADRLPEARYAVNFCEDRYHFCVAFAACLARSIVTLAPPDRSPRNLALLEERYPGALRLTDNATPCALGKDGYPIDADTLPSSPNYPAPTPIPPERLALIAFTSGSTGEPQPHAKTWGSLCESARLIEQALGTVQGKRIIATVPSQHMYGLELGILLPLCRGAVLDAAKAFFPRDIADALAAAEGPKILVTTPIHLRTLMGETGDWPTLDLAVSATAPLAPELAKECENRFRAPLLEIYGCTEAGSIASRRTVEGEAWTWFEGIEWVADDEAPHLIAAYLPEPVRLNDLIEPQEGHRFLLRGRAADLVNIAGKRNSLGALNRALLDIEGVRDGAFFLPDEADGKTARLVAFAVAPTLTAEAVLRRLREQLDPAFVPRKVYLLDALPRNATGKLPRQKLAELLRKPLP